MAVFALLKLILYGAQVHWRLDDGVIVRDKVRIHRLLKHFCVLPEVLDDLNQDVQALAIEGWLAGGLLREGGLRFCTGLLGAGSEMNKHVIQAEQTQYTSQTHSPRCMNKLCSQFSWTRWKAHNMRWPYFVPPSAARLHT